jgi:beta-lactamase superfamily II metal-dependent hydrolase
LEVGELLEPGVLHPSPAYQELLEAALRRPGLVYRQPRAGTALDWGKGLAAEVLHPSVLATDNNDSSVVIKLAFGHVSFLFTGDISEEVEEALIRRWGWRLKSTILKVAHHGSKHSSGKEFLTRVRPEAAVISCGAGNPFGHPSPEAVERLERTGAKIYRTDLQGDITVKTDGETFTIETEKDGEKTKD